jgi:tRNASer (uridine44-2'-O)-methyltransferase
MVADDQSKGLEDGMADSFSKVAIEEPRTTSSAPASQDTSGNTYTPYDLATAPKIQSDLPPEIWTIVQSAPANFTPQYFLDVNRNLLENPNLTAPTLARAELSYQSFTDATFNPKATMPEDLASIVKHLRPQCRPRLVEGGLDRYDLEWTVVRKLIPRNPKLDASLMQTCHLYTSIKDITITSPEGISETVKAERYLIIYIPHVTNHPDIPYYHPTVRSLGILYTYLPNHTASSRLPSPGTLSMFFDLFPSYPLDNRLTRTALKFLEILHKHAKGRSAGYKKRVHHDQIIPQKRFQDTYARLKGTYAKTLIEGWVEQTPPEKHVFEDLGIAAFLIELWGDMYAAEGQETKTSFPGFVDIGCGNGLLVYILNTEGWTGWGFDARRRRTWNTFGPAYVDKLKEMLLVPHILQPNPSTSDGDTPLLNTPPSHSGLFSPRTFVISNHADELTPWTPLLALLSDSPFIAIPCCSHDLGGARFRAPVHRKYVAEDPNAAAKANKGQPSAYAGLCSWVSHLTETAGYKVEKEHLRIPSTRNIAILGRVNGRGGMESLEEKVEFTKEVVEKEMGGATSIGQVRSMWMRSGGELVKPGKGGH